MSYFKAKMQEIQFRGNPTGGAYIQCSHRPLAAFMGAYVLGEGRGGEGKWQEERAWGRGST